jgi:hypothetical protein
MILYKVDYIQQTNFLHLFMCDISHNVAQFEVAYTRPQINECRGKNIHLCLNDINFNNIWMSYYNW